MKGYDASGLPNYLSNFSLGVEGLLELLKEKADDVVALSVLSFMANCANVSEKWRNEVSIRRQI